MRDDQLCLKGVIILPKCYCGYFSSGSLCFVFSSPRPGQDPRYARPVSRSFALPFLYPQEPCIHDIQSLACLYIRTLLSSLSCSGICGPCSVQTAIDILGPGNPILSRNRVYGSSTRFVFYLHVDCLYYRPGFISPLVWYPNALRILINPYTVTTVP